MKKIATLLSVLLLGGLLAVLLAFPSSAETYSGLCGAQGDNLTWNFDIDTGVLTITGSGEMRNYSGWDTVAPWNGYRNHIRELVLTDGLTTIGDSSFISCTSLDTVSLPNSLKSIGERSFYGTGLTSIAIPEGVESLGHQAFYGCRSLAEVFLPDSLTYIGYNVFYETSWFNNADNWTDDLLYCGSWLMKAKETVYTAEIRPGTLGIAAFAFNDCSALSSLQLPEGLRWIGLTAFCGCYSLPEVTLPEGLTAIGDNAFKDCSALHEVVLPEGLTTIGHYAFSGCSSLQTLVLPDSVTSLGNYALENCSGLTSLTIGCGLTETGYSAFSGCTSLAHLTIDTPTVQTWFAGWSSLTDVSFGEHVTSIGSYAFQRCTRLTGITIPDSVTKLDYGAFSDCTGLTTVTIGTGLTEVVNRPFYGCTGLTHLTVDTPTVGCWFGIDDYDRCPLTDVTLGEHVTAIGGGAFYNFSKLKEITLPEGITSIGNNAFAGCSSLTEITIPEGVTSIGGSAFSGCTGLKTFTFSDSVTTIGTSLFIGCNALEYVNFGSGIKELADNFFSGCATLKVVTLKEGMTAIGNYAFRNCAALTEISFPTSLKSIGEWAFAGCKSLTEILIPDTLEVIDAKAFKDCDSLTDVTILNGECQIEYNRETLGNRSHTVIHGYLNSTAQYYAKAYAYTFDTVVRDTPCTGAHTWGGWIENTTPSCTEQGEQVRTCMRCGFIETCKVAALGHSWGEPAYEWAEDYSTCTATCVCLNDPTHVESETAEAEGVVIRPATTTDEGEVIYTAVFEKEDFGMREIAVAIPKLEKPQVVFEDVQENAYYANAVNWAVANGITNGIDATHFAPNNTCTRAQVVTFLWRAKGSPEPTTTANPFLDVTGGYYYQAVLWAVETGVTTGLDVTHFGPNEPCTRGQVVTFLWRAEGQIEPTSSNNPFVDVTGGFCYKAILWAVENKITAGVDAMHFAPGNTCTRGQIVTFLYRDLAG